MTRINIVGRGLMSPVGSSTDDHIQALNRQSCSLKGPLGYLPQTVRTQVQDLVDQNRYLRHLDSTALLGILACQQAMQESQNWESHWGVIFGSSRGPTKSLEKLHSQFLDGERLPAMASPVTTANSIPSTIARFFQLSGMHLFVSAACSTGLHAAGLSYVLIKSGQLQGCLAGGVEDANSEFFIEAIGRSKVTARRILRPFPHRPFGRGRSGMVLSEGSCALAIQKDGKDPLAEIIGYGAATDMATLTGVSDTALGLQKAIGRALADAQLSASQVDLVIGHGASTRKGDLAEWAAIQQVFSGTLPNVFFHKWLTGHMLGASALSSVALAIEHLRTGQTPHLPYPLELGPVVNHSRPINCVMILSLGFGGNAGALIIRR